MNSNPRRLGEAPGIAAPGIWAIGEQGAFSTANFVLNILLARWLIVAEYGSFTVAFTLYLLGGALYAALVTEPMLVYGPGRYREDLARYSRHLLGAHLAASGAFAVALLGIGIVLVSTGLRTTGLATIGFALATPALLLQLLARRAAYLVTRPDIGAAGSLVYLAAMVAGLYILQAGGALGLRTAICLMVGSSLLSSAVTLSAVASSSLYRNGVEASAVSYSLTLRSVFRAHFDYGRWALGSALLAWFLGNVYYVILPIWTGLEGTAALRAAMNLILPALQATVAVGMVATPIFVQHRSVGTSRSAVARTAIALLAATAVYSALVGAGYPLLLDFLYSGRYEEYENIVPLLLAIPVFHALVSIMEAALRSIEQPRLVFLAYLAGTIVAATLGIPATASYGVAGASVVWSLSIAATAVAAIRFYRTQGY